jgi:hypothetical protein
MKSFIKSFPKSRVNRQEYLRVLARMTPSQRLLKAFELSALSRQLLKEGLRRRFPQKNEAEIHKIYLERIRRCQNRHY